MKNLILITFTCTLLAACSTVRSLGDVAIAVGKDTKKASTTVEEYFSKKNDG